MKRQIPSLVLTFTHEREAEKTSSKSFTIPDDSFTIGDLFTRMQSGGMLPVGIERQVIYDEDPLHGDLAISSISRMDVTEVAAHRDRILFKIGQLDDRQKTLKAQKEALEEAEKLAKENNDDKTTINPKAKKGPQSKAPEPEPEG